MKGTRRRIYGGANEERKVLRKKRVSEGGSVGTIDR